jgi:sugar phosphate isomerase/epimerase
MTGDVPEIRASVITSISVTGEGPQPGAKSPARKALARLSELGADWVDLYCFLEGDLSDDVLEPAAKEAANTMAARISRLNVDAFWDIWCADPPPGSERRNFIREKRITALASNLPNISSPDDGRRLETVRALEKLLLLAQRLGAPVIELVAGPDFVTHHRPAGRFPLEVTTGGEAWRSRRRALLRSLGSLNAYTARLRPPVALAIELEPGLSYLLSDWQAVEDLFGSLDESIPEEQRYVSLNLDIGHARLLCKDRPGFFRRLNTQEWRRRIAHAHISHHDERAHMADLSLTLGKREEYQPWIDLVVDAWYQGAREEPVSHAIALELEANPFDQDVQASLSLLKEWIRLSVARYRNWSW